MRNQGEVCGEIQVRIISATWKLLGPSCRILPRCRGLYTACAVSLILLEMWWRVLSPPKEASVWCVGCHWCGLSWPLELMLKGSSESSLCCWWAPSDVGSLLCTLVFHTVIIWASASGSYDDNLNFGELCSFSNQCISKYFFGTYYSLFARRKIFEKSKSYLNVLVCLGTVYN